MAQVWPSISRLLSSQLIACAVLSSSSLPGPSRASLRLGSRRQHRDGHHWLRDAGARAAVSDGCVARPQADQDEWRNHAIAVRILKTEYALSWSILI